MLNLNPKICALLFGSSPYHAKRDFSPLETEALQEIFGAAKKVLFLPFALRDHAGYTAFNKNLFYKFGYELLSLSEQESSKAKKRAVDTAESIFIGGGNTFRLLAALHAFEVFDVIREKIGAGTPYLGTSAGATLFCPTIQTTNDMPIMNVPNMRAYNFLPFQINPHFPESEIPGAAESRRDRLNEFHEENAIPIVALREGGFLVLKGGNIILGGNKPATLFRKSQPSVDIHDIATLLQ